MNHTKFKDKDTVFLLGAGASKDCGAPLIGNFLDIAFSNNVMSNLPNHEKERFECVKGFQEKTLPNSNVEELLSLISFHDRFPVVLKSFYPEKSTNATTLSDKISPLKEGYHRDHSFIMDASTNPEHITKILEDLKFLIAKTLEVTLTFKTKKQKEAFNAYKTLIKEHKNSTIITLNWDILLEDTYFEINHERIDFCHLGFEKDVKYPLILKLHGSLSWLFALNAKDLLLQIKKLIFSQKI